ncbi:dUTP diphosphatase [Candidatus Microgenomates bacterium]|nr:dUTP diphosphatase [Candidatus Microgenomates bacterium]
MKVKIKRFDTSLPMPEYKTSGAAGFDLYCKNDEEIAPGEFKLIATNLGFAVSEDSFLLVTSRGSTFHKFGLLVIPGILDSDFCGDEDKTKVQVINMTKEKVTLSKGTRFAQGIIIKIYHGEFDEVDKMPGKTRGMLGTTGYN